MVSNAHVTKADVTTSNGVVHVVDKIIIAEPPENLYRTLSGDPRFTVLTKAIKEAGLMSLLESRNIQQMPQTCKRLEHTNF